MRHRLKRKVFDGEDSCQKTRTLPTFTINSDGNPHSARKMLHSKSTYFYRWGSRLNYAVPGVCGLALLVGGIITINPALNSNPENKAYAVTGGGSVGDSDTETTAPTLSLNLTSGAAYQQTSATAGSIAYRNNVFQVGGTGMSKYVVSLNTTSGKTGELVGKDNPYATVGKVGANTAPANFGDNTWGYAVSTVNNTSVADASMTYNPVPSGMDSNNNSVEIARRSGIDKTSTVADSYKIAFAAKLGTDLPSDHYEADVYLSVVASPQATISGISTMQEMDSNVCSASSEHETKQLEDTRDRTNNQVGTGKKYWVAKLKDGNCWMTQNLDYDGGGTATTVANWPGSGTAATYYDPGLYYYNGPIAEGWATHVQYPTACPNNTAGLSSCTSNGFSLTPGKMTDDHYLVGNYYSWNAATNGTGGSITSGEASGSICPEGWKLPTSNNTNKGSFAYLLTQYGLQSSLTSGSHAIYNSPLYFVYSGFLSSGQLYGAGGGGRYWSSTPHSSGTRAYYLTFDSGVNPSSNDLRYVGNSVRCVAK